MTPTFEDRCADLLDDLGLCGPGGIDSVDRLTGGVASDIAAVRVGDRVLCVKFALAQLAVAEEWLAPVHRSRAEYAWLSVARKCDPETAPALFGYSERLNGFAMEYITGPDVYLWKSALLDRAADRGEAERLGHVLGRIHQISTAPGFESSSFDNMADFDALRIDPYLRFTAARHPDIAAPLTAMAETLRESRSALVHGDVSPKNILLRNGDPVILDAECATMGDPAFDVAFCLNHLILKAFHIPGDREALLRRAAEFATAHATHVSWEKAASLEQRVARLVPMLMLARIDGKSPVEYLDTPTRQVVRDAAKVLIAGPPASLNELMERLS
ncbi:phosphotransferase family protein [Oceaniglobus indicus]|uniref:phosphotransferase family protein n=1 Tax=Oceaniglobus indicus TaxID=2047749 RepID=UPI000C1A777C|nr:aminoglycoside phosphotransferase family protein [Oceaniglobus indicus]